MIDDARMDMGLDDERLADQVADLAEQIARGETPDLGILIFEMSEVSSLAERPLTSLISKMRMPATWRRCKDCCRQ